MQMRAGEQDGRRARCGRVRGSQGWRSQDVPAWSSGSVVRPASPRSSVAGDGPKGTQETHATRAASSLCKRPSGPRILSRQGSKMAQNLGEHGPSPVGPAVGRNHPNIDRSQPKLGRSRPDIAETGPILVKISSNFGQHRLNLGEIGQFWLTSARILPKFARLGRHLPPLLELGTILAEFGQVWRRSTQVGQTRTKFAVKSTSTKFGRNRPRSGRSIPMLVDIGSRSGRKSGPNSAEIAPNLADPKQSALPCASANNSSHRGLFQDFWESRAHNPRVLSMYAAPRCVRTEYPGLAEETHPHRRGRDNGRAGTGPQGGARVLWEEPNRLARAARSDADAHVHEAAPGAKRGAQAIRARNAHAPSPEAEARPPQGLKAAEPTAKYGQRARQRPTICTDGPRQCCHHRHVEQTGTSQWQWVVSNSCQIVSNFVR